MTPSAQKDDDEERGATAERREVVEAILSSCNGDGRLLELRPRAELRVELVFDDRAAEKIDGFVRGCVRAKEREKDGIWRRGFTISAGNGENGDGHLELRR